MTCWWSTWGSVSRHSITTASTPWPTFWASSSGPTSSAITPASPAFASLATSPTAGSGVCARCRRPSRRHPVSESSWPLSGSTTGSASRRCGPSTSIWPTGRSRIPGAGAHGSPRVPSVQRRSIGRRLSAVSRLAWTPALVSACPRSPSSSAASDNGARVPRPSSKRPVAPCPEKPSPPRERPWSARSSARAPVSARSGWTTPRPAGDVTYGVKKRTRSGRGPSSRCCGPPASASRSFSSSATTAW